jgi:hypothetical protein
MTKAYSIAKIVLASNGGMKENPVVSPWITNCSKLLWVVSSRRVKVSSCCKAILTKETMHPVQFRLT